MKICSIEGCDKKVAGRGWCSKHYRRWYEHGDPLFLARTENGAPMAWLEWALEQETDECLLWPFPSRTGGSDNKSYGYLGDGKTSHRIICERVNGPCPDNQEARHACGKSLCGNKRHLSWSTHVENEADKSLHGTKLLGEKNHTSKLTEIKVRSIKQRLRQGEGVRALAREFGVDAMSISFIKNGKNWAWVE